MTIHATIEALEPQPFGKPRTVTYHGEGRTPEIALTEAREWLRRARRGTVVVGKPKLREVRHG